VACYHPITVRDTVTVPCGQCIGCRLENARQWATRIMHEASCHDNNSYVTLTYDDEHLPPGNTLVKSHLSTFIRYLRRYTDGKIRFFGAGEYGDNTGRAHYHVCIFSFAVGGEYLGKSKTGYDMYRSPGIERAWNMGDTYQQELTFESAAYVARYTTKKLTGARKLEYRGRQAPFALMSRMPGIGHLWLEQYADDVYRDDAVIVRNHPSRPPRYYDKKFFDVIGEEKTNEYRLNRKKRQEKMLSQIIHSPGALRRMETAKNHDLKKTEREFDYGTSTILH